MVSADQVSAVKANIATIKSGDVSKTAGDFFLYFFKKYPAHQNKFPAYKGKGVDSLPSVGSWKTHTTNVTAATFALLEKSGDAGGLAAACKQTVAEHVPRGGVNAKEYTDVLAALVCFVSEALGGACNKAAWQACSDAVVASLKAAL